MSGNRDRASDGGMRIQSVDRAMRLLELVGRLGEAGVTDLAERSGLAVGTTHNLLRTLAQRHYVTSTRGRYRLGPALIALTSLWGPGQSLTSLLQPALQRMVDLTGQMANATILIGDEANLVASHEATKAITVSKTQIEWREPLYLATGRVLVALTREQDWDRIIDAEGHAEPGWSSARWREELELIKTSHQAIKAASPDPNEPQASGIAVPVWMTSGSVICSIGYAVPGNIEPGDLDTFTDALWTVTRELSAQLGCPDVPPVGSNTPRPRPGGDPSPISDETSKPG